jgi:glutathione-regulated potassium-efflux system ancillary protein KefC
MAPHQRDEKKLISIARQGRQELEELWSRERAQRQAALTRGEWHAPQRAAGANQPTEAEEPDLSDRVPGA